MSTLGQKKARFHSHARKASWECLQKQKPRLALKAFLEI